MTTVTPSNDTPLVFTGDIRELAHCKYCWEPLYIIYDHKLRDTCRDCELDLRAQAGK